MFKSVFKTGIRASYSVSENASFFSDSWAVYPAKHKQSGKMVSVFIFDKTKFETHVNRLCSQAANTRNPKQIISEVYEQIKLEVSNLTKLKHPQILTVLEVLEETRSKFIFVSEPVIATLFTLDLTQETSLSIQKGLLELCKGLQFLHDHCSIIHLNLQPTSVFVNNQGDWRLAGFKFLQSLNELSPQERESYYIMNNSSVVEYANHNLNFTAPELIIDSLNQRLSTANDIWSLGLLIFYLYNHGDQLIQCYETNSVSDFKREFRKFEQKFYNHRPSELKYMFKNVPESLWTTMTHLLARYPNDRITIDQFIDSDFFDGSLIKMMWFIDEFSTKSMSEKIVFLEGLLGQSDLLGELPATFRNSKLLPLLVGAIKSEVSVQQNKKLDPETDVFLSKALVLVFAIGQSLSSLTFQDRIYDELLSGVKGKRTESNFQKLIKLSVKIRLSIVTNTPILLQKLQQKQMVDVIKELSDLCVTFTPNELDSQEEQIKLQDNFLSNLALVVEMFDFPYIKNTLFPLVCSVFKTTTVLSTKIETIKTFDMFVEKKIIDRIIINEQLLPVVENLKSRDKRIINNLLSFFVRLSFSQHINLDLDTLVEKILGQCLRLVFGCNDCTKSEFKGMMSLVNKIQVKATEEKLNKLSDSTDSQSSENFNTLINSASIRQRSNEGPIKVPALKPTGSQPSPVKNSSPAFVQPATERTLVKPLTLSPVTQPASLRFGATSAKSNEQAVLNNANSRNSKSNISSRSASDNSKFNANSRASSEIDWSSAASSFSPVSNLTNNTSNATSPLWAPMNAQSGQTTNKLPPGFTNAILTPTSTGQPSWRGSPQNTSHGDIDLL